MGERGLQPGDVGRQARRLRGPARFTEADVKRAIKAARKANLPIAAVRIEPDGSILVIPGMAQAVPSSPPEPNDWD